MHKVDAQGRITDPFASGAIANLGDYGCAPIKIREQYRIWLRVYPDMSDPMASQFYAWSGWFQTLKPPKMVLSLAMFPKIQVRSCREEAELVPFSLFRACESCRSFAFVSRFWRLPYPNLFPFTVIPRCFLQACDSLGITPKALNPKP